MHELQITKEIIEQVISECRKRDLKYPKKVFVDVGSLSTFKKEPILYYYKILKKDYPYIAKTELLVTETDGKIRCNKCKKESRITDIYEITCPFCHANDIEITLGREVIIKEIVFEG